MSFTLSSPSCESLSRETASYSYRPCDAFVVDLMCHSINRIPRDSATSIASIVLPVPGSPLTSNGFSKFSAASTANFKSSDAM